VRRSQVEAAQADDPLQRQLGAAVGTAQSLGVVRVERQSKGQLAAARALPAPVPEVEVAAGSQEPVFEALARVSLGLSAESSVML
jgi:hypothetical protein